MTRYCIDTSAFIDARQTLYPPEMFPEVWDLIDWLVDTDRVLAPRDVLLELRKRDDETRDWANERRGIFIELEEDIQEALSRVLTECRGIIDPRRDRDGADPCVVAMALARGATVITQEKRNGRAGKRLMIPDACDVLGVKCTTFLGLLRREKYTSGWTRPKVRLPPPLGKKLPPKKRPSKSMT